MRTLATKLLARPDRAVAVLALLGCSLVAVPAQAQDFFGFFRIFAPPPAPVPTYQPFDYQAVPSFERPRPRLRPRKPAESAAIKMPDKPKAPGEVENPVPQLLADSTLRPGDMVMFPDGLRVFTGEPGERHTLADFKSLGRAKDVVPAATRKLAAHLLPGVNAAWSAEGLNRSGKLAGGAEVATTGSVTRARR